MKQGHLATAIFWTSLLTLFGWGASAQIPRPPMPIPVATKPVAIRPPVIVPTPVPPPVAVAPSLVALPPAEYDKPYTGQVIITRWNTYGLVRAMCKDVPTAIACSLRTYDGATGAPLTCLIMVGPGYHDDERVLRHEMGHCQGWSGEHERARYGD